MITEDSLVVIPDISGNGISEVGVLLQRYSDNQPFLQLRDASTGALETLIQLGANSISEALVPLADQNSNGAPEIAVLGYSANGTGRIRIYDSETAQQLNSTILAPIPGTGI